MRDKTNAMELGSTPYCTLTHRCTRMIRSPAAVLLLLYGSVAVLLLCYFCCTWQHIPGAVSVDGTLLPFDEETSRNSPQ